MKYKINEMYRDFLPANSEEVYENLVDSIKADGLLNPIVLREDTLEVVDGHHRIRACEECGVEPRFITKKFSSDAEVLIFMLMQQAGRRTITPIELSLRRGMVYEISKKEMGTNRHTTSRCAKMSHLTSNTKDVVGEAFGVSARTIMRDAELYQAYRTLKDQGKTDAELRKCSRQRILDMALPNWEECLEAGKRGSELKKKHDKLEEEKAKAYVEKLEKENKMLRERLSEMSSRNSRVTMQKSSFSEDEKHLLNRALKMLAKELHPDKGGSNDAMVKLNALKAKI